MLFRYVYSGFIEKKMSTSYTILASVNGLLLLFLYLSWVYVSAKYVWIKDNDNSVLKKILSKKIEGPICILVGPEGDFSEAERQLIINLKQAYPLSLASNILKAETAAIAAVTIVNFQLNSL